MRRRGGTKAYLVGGLVLLGLYIVLTSVLWATRGVDSNGPLGFHKPAATAPPPGARITLPQALHDCYPSRDTHSYRYKVVAGTVRGKPYFGCYEVSRDDGSVWTADVIDGRGDEVTNVTILKRTGAWRWIGIVKTPLEAVLGGVMVATLIVYCWLYYRRLRPGEPLGDRRWWTTAPIVTTLGLIPVLGWIVLARLPGVSPRRRVRVIMQGVLVWGAVLFVSLLADADYGDLLSVEVVGAVVVAVVYGVAAGRWWIAPYGFGAPEDLLPETGAASPPPSSIPSAPAGAPVAGGGPVTSIDVKVEPPEDLPSFTSIGGLEGLKRELRDIVTMALAFPDRADEYKLSWNGVLLHGPPGVGKTFFARAAAGEFGLNLVQVAAGDLVSAYRGDSARNVVEVFRLAASNVPCILFFDEFDSVAEDRGDAADPEVRRTVGQLLESLEEYHDVRELIVMAATNHLDQLDPAVIRPGRFDRQVRVDLPDEDGRQAIFEACLRDRPLPASLDLRELARRTKGLTPAAISQTVQMAAMDAFKQATATGKRVELTQDRLLDALKRRGGEDRPTVESWTWDSLVLPEKTKDELQELQLVIEEPDTAHSLGVEPPTGVLLAGPPGTGKTTVAKVLAAQAHCSFYPVTAADITSKWLGESEQNVQKLFERARENRPSVIFIDEIDGIAGARGGYNDYDRQLTELLQQMDGIAGQAGVLVIGATNRPDELDPALLRGGRLSRTIVLPLPEVKERKALLRLFTAEMPLVAVDLEDLARQTDGYSGADLHALTQQAALHALMASHKLGRTARSVRRADFEAALADHRPTVTSS